MKMIRFLFLGILAWSLSIGVANACKCDEPGSAEEAYGCAHLVVVGKVLRMSLVNFAETINPQEVPFIEGELGATRKYAIHDSLFVKVELAVTQVFKGKLATKTLIIYTPLQASACGFTEFKIGWPFVVYSSPTCFFRSMYTQRKGIEKAGTFWTTRCSGTGIARSEEITQLNKLKQKQSPGKPTQR